MEVKFERPVIGQVDNMKTSVFSESEIKKDPHGKAYIKLMQNLIDNKVVKFKSVSEMLKHFVKNEVHKGVCLGEAYEVLNAINEHGAKKGLMQEVSKTKALSAQHLHTLDLWLKRISCIAKEGGKKILKKASHDISKTTGINAKKLDAKKIDKCIQKIHKVAEKSNVDLDLSKGKEFSLRDTKHAVQYLEKKINKDKDVSLKLMLRTKKGYAHMCAAGKDKDDKPFLYDAQRGYARFKNTKELTKCLKKDYFTKHGKGSEGFNSIVISSQKFD